MIYIHLGSYVPPEKWRTKAATLTAELQGEPDSKKRKDKLDISSKQIWGKLKADLENFSFGKCWYSEAREIASHYHVDHFRPKKRCIENDGSHLEGYWWLSFDWNNYRLSASEINTAKSDKFAVLSNRATDPCNCSQLDDEIFYLLDPLSRDDISLITFNENGEAMPLNPDEDTWDHKRAKYTIETLKLNSPKLRRARKLKWKKCAELVRDTQTTKNKFNSSTTATIRAKLADQKDQIRERISPLRELSSTNRACVNASRADFGLAILQEPINIENLQQQYRESIT